MVILWEMTEPLILPSQSRLRWIAGAVVLEVVFWMTDTPSVKSVFNVFLECDDILSKKKKIQGRTEVNFTYQPRKTNGPI